MRHSIGAFSSLRDRGAPEGCPDSRSRGLAGISAKIAFSGFWTRLKPSGGGADNDNVTVIHSDAPLSCPDGSHR
jgi:hypothetical protein